MGVGVGLALLAATPWLVLWIVFAARHQLHRRRLLPAVLRHPGVRLARPRAHPVVLVRCALPRGRRVAAVLPPWHRPDPRRPRLALGPAGHGAVLAHRWARSAARRHRFVARGHQQGVAQLNLTAEMRDQAPGGGEGRRRCCCAAASRSRTTRCRCSSASTWRSGGARSSRCSARTAPASRRCSRRSAASSTRSAAPSSSTGATSPTPTACRPRRSASSRCPAARPCSRR